MAVFFSSCIPNHTTNCVGSGTCSATKIEGTDCCSVGYDINFDSSDLVPSANCSLGLTSFNWNYCGGSPAGSTISFEPMMIDTSFFSDGLDVDDDLQITVDSTASIFEQNLHRTPDLPNAQQIDCSFSGVTTPNCNRNYNIPTGTLLVTVPAGSTVKFGAVDNHGGGLRLIGKILLKPASAP
jgi:hypothetical protein